MDLGDLYLVNLAAYIRAQNEFVYLNQEKDKPRKK